MDVFMSLFSTFVVERECSWPDDDLVNQSQSAYGVAVARRRAPTVAEQAVFAATLFPSANEATLCMGPAVRKVGETIG